MQQQLLIRQRACGLRLFLGFTHAHSAQTPSIVGRRGSGRRFGDRVCPHGRWRTLAQRCFVGQPHYLAVQLVHLEDFDPFLPQFATHTFVVIATVSYLRKIFTTHDLY
jgi:hypothetical protein